MQIKRQLTKEQQANHFNPMGTPERMNTQKMTIELPNTSDQMAARSVYQLNSMNNSGSTNRHNENAFGMDYDFRRNPTIPTTVTPLPQEEQ